jgi:hypothetical protein
VKKSRTKTGRASEAPTRTASGEAPRPPSDHRSVIAAPSAKTKARAIRRAAALVVSLSKRWASDGVPRDIVIGSLAAVVAGSGDRAPILELLQALDSGQLGNVTPIEILLRIVENRPEFVPGVQRGSVLAVADPSQIDISVGQRSTVRVLPNLRAVACSLLGGLAVQSHIVIDRTATAVELLIETTGTFFLGVLSTSSAEDGLLVLDLVTVHVHG